MIRDNAATAVLPRLLKCVSRCFVAYRHSSRLLTDGASSQPKGFTTRRPSSPTQVAASRFRALRERFLLLPPVGVWAVSRPSVADRPLRPATHIGALVGHYPTNYTGRGPIPMRRPKLLRPATTTRSTFGISLSFPGLSRSLGQEGLTCYNCSRLCPRPKPGPSPPLACMRHAASVRPEPGSNS